jgi:hypothetical protein
MDNFYNSPSLDKTLEIIHKTDSACTLTRNNVPINIKRNKTKKGEILSPHSASVTVTKWRDKKN